MSDHVVGDASYGEQTRNILVHLRNSTATSMYHLTPLEAVALRDSLTEELRKARDAAEAE